MLHHLYAGVYMLQWDLQHATCTAKDPLVDAFHHVDPRVRISRIHYRSAWCLVIYFRLEMSTEGLRRSGREQKYKVDYAKTHVIEAPAPAPAPKRKAKAAGSDNASAAAPAVAQLNKWERHSRKLSDLLGKLRFARSELMTFETFQGHAGSGDGSKPSAEGELLAARRKIVDIKKKVRELLFAVDAEANDCTHWNVWGSKKVPSTSRAATAPVDDVIAAKSAEAAMAKSTAAAASSSGGADDESDDGIGAEDIGCSKCGAFECDDDNDILLCDYGVCGLAFHQQCMDPPLVELPAEDRDWFCPRCSCLLKGIFSVNDEEEEFRVAQEEEEDEGAGAGRDRGASGSGADGSGTGDHDDDDDDDFDGEPSRKRKRSALASPTADSVASPVAANGRRLMHRLRYDRVDDVYAEVEEEEAELARMVSAGESAQC